MFKIHMGVPEMKEFWASLKETVKTGKASKNDERMYKRNGKFGNNGGTVMKHVCFYMFLSY